MTKVFHSFQEMGEALGRQKRKPQLSWVKKEMDKISRCPRCGAQMVYGGNTNIMRCDNPVEKTIKGEKKVVPCGFIKYLNESTASYAQFLFENKREV